MNGRGSRQKGARAELQLAQRFTEGGIPMTRNHDGSAGQENADLDNDAGLYVECRRREKLSIPAWIREVGEKCPPDRLGVLAFRRNNEDWHVALDLDDFIALLKEAGRG